ncbi:EAL domain-containing protein [Breoghania sp.]|uniref:EAL domain-containing protein n=1 Tax=Breoghania sp. TaxID=2065378 RepID=UPI002AA6783A|nr:EAL domain-containing protein [Breoghania sp.]
MSIRHRLNIIVVTLFSALVISLVVLEIEIWRELDGTTQSTRQLIQLSEIWNVAREAARNPENAGPLRARAGMRLEDLKADSARSGELVGVLERLSQAQSSTAALRQIRTDLPNLTAGMDINGSTGGMDARMGQLVAIQIPELLMRLSQLRADIHAIRARAELGPDDRMLFLVDAGQFKASADTIDTVLANPTPSSRAIIPQSDADAFSKANRAFQKTAETMAQRINAAGAGLPFLSIDTRPLDDAYTHLVETALTLHRKTLTQLVARADKEAGDLRQTILIVTALVVLSTLLAISFALSLTRSIVNALSALERRVRAIGDGAALGGDETTGKEEKTYEELARITQAVLDCRDQVAERVAEAEQDEKRRDLELIFESNPLPLFVQDPNTGTIQKCNSTAMERYGYTQEEFSQLHLSDLVAPSAEVEEEEGNRTSVVRHCKANGEIIEVLPFEREIRYEGKRMTLTSIVDITARRQAEARLAFLAHFDPLTHLANRVLMQRNLIEEVQRAREEEGYSFSLLCLDLDRFKMVNDTLGHDAGDRVLRIMADRLTALVKNEDIVARLGGDEFTILVRGPDGTMRSEELAENVRDALGETCAVDGARLALGGSVGVSHYPEHGENAVTLMKHADLALHQAKVDGRGLVRIFEPYMDEALRRRQTLEADLLEALEHDRFEINYQPLIDMSAQTVSGFEALLRWNDPVRGRVPPTEFIPIAEEVGLIDKIGTWVLNAACAEVADWPNGVKVAVNVSSYQFRAGNLVERVRKALETSGLEPERLELEITESVLLADSAATIQTLHEIRDMGVRIAMDDFGTGYSSLSYLRSFPFDKVKIDRSFVSDLGNKAEANAIVRAIAGLSKELGMMTTAEGIETEEQYRHILEHGCSQAQGFLTGRPLPASEARLYAAGQAEMLRDVLERMREKTGDTGPKLVSSAAS